MVVEFGEEATAFDMWSKILNQYQKTTAGTKAYHIMKLCSAQCDDNKSLEEFCREFEANIRALKSAGGNMDELVSVVMFLSKVPKSYDGVKQALLTLDENELTMERVKNRLMEVRSLK